MLLLLLCIPLSYPKHINETLNSRESVALGGCFFSPLVLNRKSIECSIISDHTIEAVYQTITDKVLEQKTAFIIKKGDELKFSNNSDWLMKKEIVVLKGHDIVIMCDDEENSGSQKVLCVLQYSHEDEPAYSKDGLLSITIGFDMNGILQLDGKEEVFE